MFAPGEDASAVSEAGRCGLVPVDDAVSNGKRNVPSTPLITPFLESRFASLDVLKAAGSSSDPVGAAAVAASAGGSLESSSAAGMSRKAKRAAKAAAAASAGAAVAGTWDCPPLIGMPTAQPSTVGSVPSITKMGPDPARCLSVGTRSGLQQAMPVLGYWGADL